MAIQIGLSKTKALIDKVSSTSLRSVGYGENEPLVVKKLPAASGSNKGVRFDLEVKYPIQARIDDTERITKLLTKYQGIKWEGHTAALQSIQNNLEDRRSNPRTSTMAARSSEGQSIAGRALATFKNVGKSLITAAGFTASTLAQVALSGTGEHQEPFLVNSYLKTQPQDRYSILGQIVASFGFGGNNSISGAQRAKAGTDINVTAENAAYTFVEEGNEGHSTHNFKRVQKSRYSYDNTNSDDRVKANAFKIGCTSEETQAKLSELDTYPAKASTILDTQNLERQYENTTAYATGSNAIQIERFSIEEDIVDQFSLIPFEICSIAPKSKRRMFFQANLDSYDDSYSADWGSTSYVGRADKFYTYGGFTRDINFSFKAVALVKSHLIPLYKSLNHLAATTTPDYGRMAGNVWYYDRTKPFSEQSPTEQAKNVNKLDLTGYIESGSFFDVGEGGLDVGDGVFMRGTISRITIGDLLYKQYGIIKSVKFSWEVDVPWEIDGDTTIVVPHMLNVSVGFTPIHNFVPASDVISYFGNLGKVRAGDTSVSGGEILGSSVTA